MKFRDVQKKEVLKYFSQIGNELIANIMYSDNTFERRPATHEEIDKLAQLKDVPF